MPQPRVVIHPKQVLAEGDDTRRVIVALVQHLQIPDVQVADFGGKDELRSYLRTLRSSPDFEDRVTAVAIIRDADDDPAAAFQSVRNALRAARLPEPLRPELPTGAEPRVSVYILPAAGSPGMLESLCLQAVADDPATRCIDAYFDCLLREMGGLPRNMPKARVHAFLSSRPRPGMRLAEAAEAGVWPWDHPVFEPLKAFLRAL